MRKGGPPGVRPQVMVTVERKFAKDFLSVIAPLKLHRKFDGNQAVNHAFHFILAKDGALRATNGVVQVAVNAPGISAGTAVIPYETMKEAVADKTGEDLYVDDDGILRTAVAHPYFYAVPAPEEIPELEIGGYEKEVLSLPAGELAEAWELASPALDEREPRVVFRFTLVRCREGKAVLVAANGQFLVEAELPGRTLYEGDILVPPAALSTFTKAARAFKVGQATLSVVLAGEDLRPELAVLRDEGGCVCVKARTGSGVFPEYDHVFPRSSMAAVELHPALVRAVEATGKRCREGNFSLLLQVYAHGAETVAVLSLFDKSYDQETRLASLPVRAQGEGILLVKPYYLRAALKILAARNGRLEIFGTDEWSGLAGTGRVVRLVALGERIPESLRGAA